MCVHFVGVCRSSSFRRSAATGSQRTAARHTCMYLCLSMCLSLCLSLCVNEISEGNKFFRDVRLHPTKSTWVLGSTMSEGCDKSAAKPTALNVNTGQPQYCYKQVLSLSQSVCALLRVSFIVCNCNCVSKSVCVQLWVSKDFGASWTHCVDYVVQFDWSPPVGKPNVRFVCLCECVCNCVCLC